MASGVRNAGPPGGPAGSGGIRPPEADAASTGSGRVAGNGASLPRHRVKKKPRP